MEPERETASSERSNDSLMKGAAKFTPDVQLMKDNFQAHTPSEDADIPMHNTNQQGLPFSVHPSHSRGDDDRSWAVISPHDQTDVNDERNAPSPTCTDSCDGMSEYFEAESDFKDGFSSLSKYLGDGYVSPCSEDFQEILANDFLGIGGPMNRSRSWNDFSALNDLDGIPKDVFFDCSPLVDPGRDQHPKYTENLRQSNSIIDGRIQTTTAPSDREDVPFSINTKQLRNLKRYLNKIDAPNDGALIDINLRNLDITNTTNQVAPFLPQGIPSSTSSLVSALEEQVNKNSDLKSPCSSSASDTPDLTVKQETLTENNPTEQVSDSHEKVEPSNNEATNHDNGETSANVKAAQIPSKSSSPVFTTAGNGEKKLSSIILDHAPFLLTEPHSETFDTLVNCMSSTYSKSIKDIAQYRKENVSNEGGDRQQAINTVTELNLNDQQKFTAACSQDKIPEFSNEVEIPESSENNSGMISLVDTEAVHTVTDTALQSTVDETGCLNTVVTSNAKTTSEVSATSTANTAGEHLADSNVPLTKSSYLNALEITRSETCDLVKSVGTQSLVSNGVERKRHPTAEDTEETNIVTEPSETPEAHARKVSNRKFESDIFEWFREKKEKETKKREISPLLREAEHIPLQEDDLKRQKHLQMDKPPYLRNGSKADAHALPSCSFTCPKVCNDVKVEPQASTSGISTINLRSNRKKVRRTYTEPSKTYMTRNKTRRSMNEKGKSSDK